MVNAVGLQNIGVHAFVAEKLPQLRQYDTAIIANVFGYSISEYTEVIRILEDAQGWRPMSSTSPAPMSREGGSSTALIQLLRPR